MLYVTNLKMSLGQDGKIGMLKEIELKVLLNIFMEYKC